MKLFITTLLLLSSFFIEAQNSLSDTLKLQLIRDWERAKAYTAEYLDAMPADKYGFRPVDSIRSFAEQMLHFSMSNVGLIFFGTGYKDSAVQKMFFRPNFEKTTQNKDSII